MKFKSFISSWVVRYKNINMLKNIIMSTITQVILICGVYDMSFKRSLLAGLLFFVIYSSLAYVIDRYKVWPNIDKEDYKRTHTWQRLFKRLDELESKINKLTKEK